MAASTSRKIGHFITGLLASGMAALTLVGTQALTGRENLGALLVGYSGGWFLLFGLAAVLPMLFSVTGRQSLFAAFLPFGVGGAVAGALIAILIATHQLGGSSVAVAIDFAIPFTVPWVIGSVAMYFRHQKVPPGSRVDQ